MGGCSGRLGKQAWSVQNDELIAGCSKEYAATKVAWTWSCLTSPPPDLDDFLQLGENPRHVLEGLASLRRVELPLGDRAVVGAE
jgi:hypothetical protein